MVGKSVGSEEADGRRGGPFCSRSRRDLEPPGAQAHTCGRLGARAFFVGHNPWAPHLDVHTTPPPKVQRPNGRTPGRPCEARSLAGEGCQGLSRKTRHETTLACVGPVPGPGSRATHPTWRGWRAAKDRGPRMCGRAQPPGGADRSAVCARRQEQQTPAEQDNCERREQTRIVPAMGCDASSTAMAPPLGCGTRGKSAARPQSVGKNSGDSVLRLWALPCKDSKIERRRPMRAR